MGRSPVRLKKGSWTPEEDRKLTAYIQKHGHRNWRALPANAGLQRCGKSCRMRWLNYLRPDLKRGKFSLQEDRTIVQLHALLGNKWSTIAAHLPKRTDNEIKNHWNTHLKKRLRSMGIDPITHKPKTDGSGQSKDTAYLSHMAQWESARLEAEARLAKESKSQVQNQLDSSSFRPVRLIISQIPAQPSRPPCLDVLKALQNSWSSETESPSVSAKANNGMHNMYAIVRASSAGNLVSPTSTLEPPQSTLPISTTIGQINETLLLPPSTDAVAAAAVELGKTTTSGNKTWENPVKGNDITVAVEAFRAARYENNIDNAVMPSSGSFMGVVEKNDMLLLAYDPKEKSAAENGEGSSCNVNIEENEHDWHSILNLITDLDASGWPAF